MTNGSNGINARIVKQQAAFPVEHTAEETSENSGETSSTFIAERGVVSHPSLVKPSLERLAKVR